jgi:hypothetical protein
MQFKNKSEVLNKIVELAAILHVNGELTEDGQSQFISNMIMTILTASQDANHARLLHKNVMNFIDEVYVNFLIDQFSYKIIQINRHNNYDAYSKTIFDLDMNSGLNNSYLAIKELLRHE